MQVKSEAEIKILAEGGKILADIMRRTKARARVGVKASELDRAAEQMILKAGGEPSFKGFGPAGQEFPASLCVSPNDMLVHGIPGAELVFKEGDLIGLDLGMKYKGFYTDHAITIGIGKISPAASQLLLVTEECLRLGIAAAQAGNKLGDNYYVFRLIWIFFL